MADDDELTRLRAENQDLRSQLEHALAQLAQVSEQLAVAQTRIGVRIASLVAFLAQSLRLPIRRFQAYLRVVHSLTISTGEVVELLHAVRRKLQPQVDALKTQARASPILYGDETS